MAETRRPSTYTPELAFWLHNMAGSIRHFIADYYKQNPAVAYGKIESPWSLDAPIHDTDLRLIATASEGLW